MYKGRLRLAIDRSRSYDLITNLIMAKTIAIIGATGTQGSSVANTLLDPVARESWTVRAITRNVNGKAARALLAKGAEVVEADLDSPDSLRAAFSGCHAVFALTDFFVPFAANGANAAEAIELEWQRACNIADAVSASLSVEHFIWSTLPHAGRIAGGKLHPAHFVAKNRLDDRIKSDPDLFRRTTFLWVGWYATNFLYPVFAPTRLVRRPHTCQNTSTHPPDTRLLGDIRQVHPARPRWHRRADRLRW